MLSAVSPAAASPRLPDRAHSYSPPSLHTPTPSTRDARYYTVGDFALDPEGRAIPGQAGGGARPSMLTVSSSGEGAGAAEMRPPPLTAVAIPACAPS